MSFLTYLGEEIATLALLPRRVYGRIDAFEPPDEGPGWPPTVTFDSLDADWFDREGSDIPWLGAVDILEEVNRRISAVVAPVERLPWFPAEEGEWYELEFGEGDDVEYFVNLFAAPVPRRVRWFQPVVPPVRERLDAITGIGDIGHASENNLRARSRRCLRRGCGSIYDVGHGNRTALVDGREVKAVLRLRRRRAAQPRNIPGTLEQLLPVRGGDDHPVPLGLRSLVFRPARHTSAVTDMDRV